MNFQIFVTIVALFAITQAQIYYSAPAVAEYAWPAVGESSPYYSAAYKGIPVYSPYAYAVGSDNKGASTAQKPSASLTNDA